MRFILWDVSYDSSGVYTNTYIGNNNCDSIASLDLTVSQSPSILQDETSICFGDSIVESSNQTTFTNCILPNNLQSGLVAYFPFCGNANDQSANLNNGIVNGPTLTSDRFGNANSAYEFDGSNDYISIPYSSSIGISNTYSISVWFLMTGVVVIHGYLNYTSH